ncbi:hypothetical protein KM043_012588 [Ampulex compressa]|nr:hypothetical protein KM043_012588 [Ampulex compressa]
MPLQIRGDPAGSHVGPKHGLPISLSSSAPPASPRSPSGLLPASNPIGQEPGGGRKWKEEGGKNRGPRERERKRERESGEYSLRNVLCLRGARPALYSRCKARESTTRTEGGELALKLCFHKRASSRALIFHPPGSAWADLLVSHLTG